MWAQRDAHAAFNLAHYDPNTEAYDIKSMEKAFPSYIEAEKEWLKTKKGQRKYQHSQWVVNSEENCAGDLPF